MLGRRFGRLYFFRNSTDVDEEVNHHKLQHPTANVYGISDILNVTVKTKIELKQINQILV